jgi:hypothetical protein
MEWLLIVALILVVWGYYSAKQKRKAIEEHKRNLLKGGLIPRAPKEIHEASLRELGQKYPNKKLPHARYFDP